MLDQVLEVGRLFLGSVVLRPYVYVFLICYFVFSVRHMGWVRSLTFLVTTYLIAFFCEYNSTRNGFPFGFYTYIDTTRDRELWISNVPFWDSLSFVFLSYFSWLLAGFLVARGKDLNSGLTARVTPWFGGVLMTLLDVVIDPVALQGHKWFLGQIYFYPHEGFYFGVTAANFAGWFFVGFATQWVFILLLRLVPGFQKKMRQPDYKFVWGVFGVYAGVFLFNLAITIGIRDYVLAMASTAVMVVTLLFVGFFLKDKTRHLCRS